MVSSGACILAQSPAKEITNVISETAVEVSVYFKFCSWMFSFPPKTEVLILSKGCTLKFTVQRIAVSANWGQEFSCSGEQIFIECYFMPDSLVPYSLWAKIGVREELSFNLVDANQFLLVQTPSSVNWNCPLAAADTDGSLVSVSSSHFSLLPPESVCLPMFQCLKGLAPYTPLH